MRKQLIAPDELVRDAWAFAHLLDARGVRPEMVLGIARGGALVAIFLHEALEVLQGRSLSFGVLGARSYSGIGAAGAVEVEDPAAVLSRAPEAGTVLLVDDIFDRGRTLIAVRDRLREAPGGSRRSVETATLYRKPANHEVDDRPDHHLRDVEDWLVLPHELHGLSEAELRARGFEP
jgi:uncharacterized protein